MCRSLSWPLIKAVAVRESHSHPRRDRSRGWFRTFFHLLWVAALARLQARPPARLRLAPEIYNNYYLQCWKRIWSGNLMKSGLRRHHHRRRWISQHAAHLLSCDAGAGAAAAAFSLSPFCISKLVCMPAGLIETASTRQRPRSCDHTPDAQKSLCHSVTDFLTFNIGPWGFQLEYHWAGMKYWNSMET